MKKRFQVLIGIGSIAIFLMFIYWGNQTNHKLTSLLSPQPKYQGETLGYWLAHWYQQYGDRNMEAEEAVRSMGTNAVPYLVKWIGRPCRSTADYDFCGRALKGFEVLGQTASPAIPDLVKIIGRNGNFIACAVGYIGTNAISALTQKLLESVTATNEPTNLFDHNGHPTEKFGVQRNILESLSMMGTNAQSAVPALISYLHDPRARELGDAATVLAIAGQNQPDMVIPELVNTFSSSSGYIRAETADALATFGTNALSAIPVLLRGEQDKDANNRAHIAVAIKQIAPQTPNALEPVIQNLEHREACQQTLYALEKLGTNGVEALPTLARCLRDPDSEVRTETEQCIQGINQYSDEIIVALGENLSSTNSFTSQQAVFALCKFANRSKLAFITAIKKGICGGISKDDRDQTKSLLIEASRENPTFMLECLDDPDAKVRLGALAVFYDLARGVPEAIPKLRQMAANDPDVNVRSRAADVLKLQLQ